MSRPASTTSTATTTTTTTRAPSRSLSVKTNTKPQALNPIPASDIRLFVTNLRLLDFDLRSDWPGITIQTFSAKNADQKQRISGTEWALFRLFEIWDPNETAQKLQPFFPPLEPLQSLNLRAALYRCLNELKKDGVLGRESVLRKTMLDECKGDKFFEVLTVFSATVLKKVLAARERNVRHAANARKLATATTLSADQQQSLLPLAIAHKAALINVLKQKEEKRKRFKAFEGLLDKKADDINRRIRKCKDTPRAKRPAVPPREAEAVKKQLTNNWIGNQKWLDIMLHGDDVQAEDAFLNSRFDKVWHMVEKGRKLEDVANETGLLENLQSRVQEQNTRLQKWESFHQDLKKENVQSSSAVDKQLAGMKEFRFDGHLQHQLPSSKQKNNVLAIRRPSMRAEFQDILTDMDVELSRVSKSRTLHTAAPLSRRCTLSSNSPRLPARSRKNTRSESIPKAQTSPARITKHELPARKQSLTNAPVLPPPRHIPAAVTPTDSEATLIGHPSTVPIVMPIPHGVESPTEVQHEYEQDPEPTPPTPNPIVETSSPPPAIYDSPQNEHRSPSPEPTPRPSEPPIPVFEPPELDPEEALAEQIITSIGDATPSPVKKPQPRMSMSLMERTRMSMARTSSFEPMPESPGLPLPSMPPPSIIETEPDRQGTLLERTRLSMVAMSNRPPLSAREKKEKRQSRQSLFPVNQFDTPRNRKSIERIEESRSSSEHTPTEILFTDEVDYDRVFKSRPKIATSPIFSPNNDDEEFEDDVTGIDLGDVDQDDDDDDDYVFAKSLADSPSRRAGGVVRY